MSELQTQASRTRRDHLKQLQAFCEVVRAGSVSAAARNLNSSQPMVSNHVRAFEDELGTPLFRRVGGGMVPSGICRHVYRMARPLVTGLHRLPLLFEDYHRGDMSEPLRVGAGEVSATFVLPAILRRFQARFPGTRIELRSGSGRDRLRWLRNFELDVVVTALAVVPDDVAFCPLTESEVAIITPEDHPLGDSKRVGFREIARHPMVVPSSRSYVRQILEVVFSLHGLRPTIAVEADGWGTMISHVAAGLGVAFVPDLCVDDRAPLRKIILDHPYELRKYGIVTRRDHLMGLTARRFLELAGAGTDSGDATGEA
ncbi:MAG: LysR family transcriptional regulator [Rhodospirillales bacterium]|nr:LysR family transcriptional regulator [Rhodospirillales bacterium]